MAFNPPEPQPFKAAKAPLILPITRLIKESLLMGTVQIGAAIIIAALLVKMRSVKNGGMEVISAGISVGFALIPAKVFWPLQAKGQVPVPPCITGPLPGLGNRG